MKFIFTMLCSLLLSYSLFAQDKNQIPTIYIDKEGVMRWSDSNSEASFYGVNYTLPFAHAFRAMNYLGKDHKEAIDKDVYHFARLGFNAYRIHIWDVEISTADGGLIENEHLDLLDYLIAKLRERNIRILITTMTNFGNGYPEKNINTGAFSYLYDKCKVHSDLQAIKAQENYISQLVKHTNPYTHLSYKEDPYIIGFEINNEPCHADTPKQTEEYINRMLSALKKAGNKKPVFYNVSHNMAHVEAYFKTAVQGTTYQWYPIGLVAGHTREGNLLPYVDNYAIPFSAVKGFDRKAKAVYEFDPADIIYSYMYPAMARSFRSKGFQWITQFAYDPIDMAWANTEYQTHFLNLAYTPAKAISMKIAAEVAYLVPTNKQYAKYPNDTIFDGFRVSYSQDLSELNIPGKFYYSNNTDSSPIAFDELQSIVGYGSSPVVKYEGKGAYFLDKLEDGVWRLEVMPDAVQIADPFAKPSLDKEVVTIIENVWNMEVRLPGLGENFTVEAINKGNVFSGLSKGMMLTVKPGVYLLKRADYIPQKAWNATTSWNNILLGEFVAPEPRAQKYSIWHQPSVVAEVGKPVVIKADIAGPSLPDSVIVYTDKISFWQDNNPYVKMKRVNAYSYDAEIPADMLSGNSLRYTIVVCANSKRFTFPADVEGDPLDWDYADQKYWETKIVKPDSPIQLVKVTDEYSNIDTYGVPETSYISANLKSYLTEGNRINYTFNIKDDSAHFFWRKNIKDITASRKEQLMKSHFINFDLKNIKGITSLNIGFVTSDGFTYSAPLSVDKDGIYKLSLSQLNQTKTALLPAPYPSFLERYFIPDIQIPFKLEKIEILEISTNNDITKDAVFELGSVWLE